MEVDGGTHIDTDMEVDGNKHIDTDMEVDGDIHIDTDSLERDISEAEEYEANRVLKKGKAAGQDGTISELLKSADGSVVPFLVRYFNKLFSSGRYPDSWSEAVIQPLYEKDDPSIPDNCRGTFLLNSPLSSHPSLNREGCWGTTHDFANSFLHFPLFSTAFWDLKNSRPIHSLMLSSHLFLCLPSLLPPFTSLKDGFGQT